MKIHHPPCANLSSRKNSLVLGLAAVLTVASAQAQTQGPSSSRAPYLVSSAPAGMVLDITSIATTADLVPLTGGAPGATYEVGGVPDGLGARDNGDGTFTLLCNHEIPTNALGVVRRHGGLGAYVEELIVDKATLTVLSSSDLIAQVFDNNGVAHNAANGNALAFGRFCSGDQPAATAYYNPASGLGTQERIWMCGEEGPATGWNLATVATGPNKGNAYLLYAFDLSTNGSGLTGVGAWENTLACPFPQDLTVVAANSDGGTGIMNNTVMVYVGTKQSTGNEVEMAGLTNGTLYFVNVAGNTAEIVNTTSRATNITSGTRFSLATTTSTTFSRPEDGTWNPANPSQYFFVTTDRLDTSTSTGSNPTIGATGTAAPQIGMARLWRLTFDDITNPTAGGVIDLLIDGGKNGVKVQMFDNITATADGNVYINEDPGNSTYIGKIWYYEPATDQMTQVAKFDPAIWGDLAAAGGTPGATLPWINDKETSGIVDVTSIFSATPGHGERFLLTTVQDHSTNPPLADVATTEGGQLLLIHIGSIAGVDSFGTSCGNPGPALAATAGSRPVLGGNQLADVTSVPAGSPAFMAIGLSNTTFNGGPLPLDLTGLGMQGCFLYHDLAFGLGLPCTPQSATTAEYSLAIPNSTLLLNLQVQMQVWTPDAAANAAGIVTSNALTLTLGSR